MLKIPVDNAFVAEKITNSPHIVAGRNLIERLIEDRIVPDGFYPVISGGVVRDVFFKEQTPHDVDIFIARSSTTGSPMDNRTQTQRNDDTALFIEDFVCWADDNEVELRRLTQEEREEYDGSALSIIEIFEFTWMDQTIQIMFNIPVSIAHLCDHFPIMARFFLTKEELLFTLNSFMAIQFPVPVVVTSRDIRYAAKKWPSSSVYAFTNTTELITSAARFAHGLYSVSISSLFNGAGDAVPVSVTHVNSPRAIGYSMIGHRFDVPDATYLDSPVRLEGYWSNGLTPLRGSNQNTSLNTVLQGAARVEWGSIVTRSRGANAQAESQTQRRLRELAERGTFEASTPSEGTFQSLGRIQQQMREAVASRGVEVVTSAPPNDRPRTLEEVRIRVNNIAQNRPGRSEW